MPPSAQKPRAPVGAVKTKGTPSSAPKATPRAAATPKPSTPKSTPKSPPDDGAAANKVGVSDAIRDKQAHDGHRNTNREKHMGSSANMAMGGKAGAKHEAFLRAGATKTMSEAANIKPSSEYQALAEQYAARAAKMAERAGAGDTLLSRLGAKLDEKQVGKLDAKANIVYEWDKNSDGKISQSEFRLQMRAFDLIVDDIKAVDALFKDFDADGNGFLELAELKVAFKRALIAHKAASASSAGVKDRVAALAKMAEQATEVMERTAELEVEEISLKEMKEKRGATLEEKLGSMVTKKNAHLSDLTKMDTSSDGLIDKAEFRTFVRGVGIKDNKLDNDEVDALYDTLDHDKSGTLDLKELKETLSRLQMAASKAANDLTDEADLVAQMVKIVGKAQARMAAAVRADDMIDEHYD